MTDNAGNRELTDDFDPLAREDFNSAHALYSGMRSQCPVAHSNEWNGFWALLRYQDVVDVLRDHQTYITSVQNVVPKVAFTGRRPPLHLDPPEHTPYRQALNPFFKRSRMEAFLPTLREVTVSLLQPYVDAGGGDICQDFTHKYPGYLFAEFFGLSKELSMRIKETTCVYDKALQEANDELVKETSLQLYAIARDIIEERKANPRDPKNDITSALLAKTYEGEPLPDAMVLGTIRQMIVVGMIAPSVFIGTMLHHLCENPDLQDQLRAEPELIPAAIEEYLRLFTPYRGFARTARKDVEIGGRLIKKNEPIALVYASANRDEAVFPDGDKFILNRPNIKDHVAFGLGPHRCAGEPLARLMLQVTLEEFLSRTKKIELAGEVKMTRWPEWGTLAVPLKVVAA
ncbi:cytochrome P450 [Gilvimarinus sp. F26214L]|uniref:cytochrome P450 n=1 Tax=Gilvimarinus sp. DZF01 TaxID=3461371 RepID=UPI004045F392